MRKAVSLFQSFVLSALSFGLRRGDRVPAVAQTRGASTHSNLIDMSLSAAPRFLLPSATVLRGIPLPADNFTHLEIGLGFGANRTMLMWIPFSRGSSYLKEVDLHLGYDDKTLTEASFDPHYTDRKLSLTRFLPPVDINYKWYSATERARGPGRFISLLLILLILMPLILLFTTQDTLADIDRATLSASTASSPKGSRRASTSRKQGEDIHKRKLDFRR